PEPAGGSARRAGSAECRRQRAAPRRASARAGSGGRARWKLGLAGTVLEQGLQELILLAQGVDSAGKILQLRFEQVYPLAQLTQLRRRRVMGFEPARQRAAER